MSKLTLKSVVTEADDYVAKKAKKVRKDAKSYGKNVVSEVDDYVAKKAKKARKDVKDYAKLRREFKEDIKRTHGIISEGELSNSEKRSAEQFLESLHQSLNETYAEKSGARKGEYLTSLDRLKRRHEYAKEVIDSGFKVENLRKNEIFTRDINQASIGGVSTKSKEEVKIFYAATKNAWAGLDITKRHQAIMDYFGVDTLEEAWEKVFENPDVQKALEKAKKAQNKIESEQDIIDGSTDVKEVETSPDYIEEMIVTLDTKRTFQ